MIGVIAVAPAIIGIGVIRRFYGVALEFLMPWYYLGIVVALFVFTWVNERSLSKFTASTPAAIAYVLLGMTFGAIANVFTFRAYASAPNAGLVQALQELAIPIMMVVGYVLAKMLPHSSLFKGGDQLHLGWTLCGTSLVIAGALILIFRATLK
jgi:hypothetical protein